MYVDVSDLLGVLYPLHRIFQVVHIQRYWCRRMAVAIEALVLPVVGDESPVVATLLKMIVAALAACYPHHYTTTQRAASDDSIVHIDVVSPPFVAESFRNAIVSYDRKTILYMKCVKMELQEIHNCTYALVSWDHK